MQVVDCWANGSDAEKGASVRISESYRPLSLHIGARINSRPLTLILKSTLIRYQLLLQVYL